MISGTFFVKNVVPQANGESSKVKIKIRINSHGIFEVKSASLVEKLDNEEEKQTEMETMDVDEGKNNGEVNDEESKPAAGEKNEEMQTDQQSPTESSSETNDVTTPEKQV